MKQLLFAISIIFFASCSQQSEYPQTTNKKLYTRIMYGDKWPFIYDSVTVTCIDTKDTPNVPIDMAAYIATANGVAYGMNGVAIQEFQVPSVTDICRWDSSLIYKAKEAGINTDALKPIKMSYDVVFHDALITLYDEKRAE